MMLLTCSILAASLVFPQNPPARVQPAESEAVAELRALRKSVDQLIDVMKLYAQQSADRDSALVLAQVIDMDERRITQLQQRLDALHQSKAAIEKDMGQMRGSLETYTQMAQGDPTGKAQAMMAQEKIKTNEQLEQKTNAILQLEGQIAQLDGEISNRKQAVLEMRQKLDQKIR